jgi:hypothetical protein
MMQGNHEETWMRRNDAADMHGDLCGALHVPNMGHSTVFDLIFMRMAGKRHKITPYLPYHVRPVKEGYESWRVRVFAHHGAGAANTPGGKLNKLKDAMDYFPRTDLVLLAHSHDKHGWRTPRLDCNEKCTEIVAREQVGQICGGYLRSYADSRPTGRPSYPELKLYRPVCLGMGVVRIRPYRQKVVVEI